MAAPERRIDWPGLMRAGLHGLGLQPRDFWALTPVELMVMLGREGADSRFTRASLDALMAQFPDATPRREKGDTDERS